jgi:POT family proton-dependent oligopeptide transporter
MAIRLQFILLAIATFFDRFGWNGFRAGFVLHLVSIWTKNGTDKQAKAQADYDAMELNAWVAASVYILAVGVGKVAKSSNRQRNLCLLGAIFLSIGYSLSCFGEWWLYVGLVFVTTGRSALMPILRAMVGTLYANRPQSVSDSAFILLYMIGNLGTFLGIVTSGLLMDSFNVWEYAVLVSCLCALLCTIFTWFFRTIANRYSLAIDEKTKTKGNNDDEVQIGAVVRIKVILLLTMFAVLFWVGFEQKTGALTLFASDRTEQHVWEIRLTPQWFQAVNPLLIVVLYFPISLIFHRLDRRQSGPISPITKMAWGVIFLGCGYLLLVVAELISSGQLVSPLFLIGLYLFHTIGELCLEPIGQSLVSRLAPTDRQRVFWLAIWDAASFFAILLAGYIPKWAANIGAWISSIGWEVTGVSQYFPLWIILTAFAFSGGVLLWLLSSRLTNAVRPWLFKSITHD